MCAICGIVKQSGGIDPEIVRRMARVMDYRGPDEEGYFSGGRVMLGHRRLSIIDLSTGRQPMANEDGAVHLICNGEIYNFQELRKELEGKGHRFSSRSDNEVILHLYEEKGPECVKALRGMFSFAIWDDRTETLMLARDRVGKKPLVYAGVNDAFVFASELKSLLLYPGIKQEVDPAAVDLFLTYQAIPSPHTIFRGIHKLPPAHYLIWRKGAVAISRYWDVDFTRKLRLGSEAEYADLLWEKLKEAVKIRMISDVPLGAFLSGGIDSSAVVGLMSGFSAQPVKTFSVGFDEQDFSELHYADMVAKRFGTDHHQFIVKPDVIEILPKLVWHYNEPFGDSSMVPTYYVARETKRHVTVALNGDGGDESLGGYERYRQTMLLQRLFNMYRRLPKAAGRRCAAFFARMYERHPGHTLARIGKWVQETDERGFDYAYNRRLISFSESYKEALFSPWMRRELAGFDAFGLSRSIWEQAGDIGLLEKMLYSDFHLYLPEVLMVKMDIATMANSLEGRSPFLDHEVIETAASFPSELKLRGNVSKYILKRKLKGFLPDPILKRGKMGFGVPVGGWFRKELKPYLHDVVLSDRALRRPYFEPEYVKQMVQEHTSGKIIHTSRLWLLLNFELWNRIFVDGEKP